MTLFNLEDGKVFALVGANIAGGVGQLSSDIEAVLKVIFWTVQIVIAILTAVYIYRKIKKNK